MVSAFEEALQFSEVNLFDSPESDIGFLAEHFSQSCGETITSNSIQDVLFEVGELPLPMSPKSGMTSLEDYRDSQTIFGQTIEGQDPLKRPLITSEATDEVQTEKKRDVILKKQTRGRKMSDQAFQKLSIKEQDRRIKNRLSAKKTRVNRLNQIATLSAENKTLCNNNTCLLKQIQDLTDKIQNLECEKKIAVESNKLLKEKNDFQEKQIKFLTKMMEK